MFITLFTSALDVITACSSFRPKFFTIFLNYNGTIWNTHEMKPPTCSVLDLSQLKTIESNSVPDALLRFKESGETTRYYLY